jgi:hypothetical protein
MRLLSQEEGAESSDDEIFKVVSKPRHTPGQENGAHVDEDDADKEARGGLGGSTEELFEKPRVSKRSMKKIKVNGGNGTRVVFDDDTGEALNPLVQMMRGGLGAKYIEVCLVSCCASRHVFRTWMFG